MRCIMYLTKDNDEMKLSNDKFKSFPKKYPGSN